MKIGDKVKYIGDNKNAVAAGIGTVVQVIKNNSVEFVEVHFRKPLYVDNNSFCFDCLPIHLEVQKEKVLKYYDGRY